MNKLWLLSGVLLAPISLMAILLQVMTTGFGVLSALAIVVCSLPLIAFYGLAMQKIFLTKLFWRFAMWLIALALLVTFVMPFLYMTFGYPPVEAGDNSGLYEIYIASGVLSIFSVVICFGMYKYSEFVGKKNA